MNVRYSKPHCNSIDVNLPGLLRNPTPNVFSLPDLRLNLQPNDQTSQTPVKVMSLCRQTTSHVTSSTATSFQRHSRHRPSIRARSLTACCSSCPDLEAKNVPGFRRETDSVSGWDLLMRRVMMERLVLMSRRLVMFSDRRDDLVKDLTWKKEKHLTIK